MEQEAQEKLREIQQNTMNEAENEEEVLARQDEYIQHPLFETLQKFTDDLHDFVIKQREKNELRLQENEEEKN